MLYRIVMAICLFCLTCLTAYGMSVDKMMLVSEGPDHDFFEVTNTTEQKLFVSVQITVLEMLPKGTKKVVYNADNIDDWKINVNPSRMILEPGEKKIVFVNVNQCQGGKPCQFDQDAIFTIGFVPHIYNDPNSSEKDKSVGILFGFEPTFIIPATKENMKYKYKLVQKDGKDALQVTNQGNTTFTMLIDECEQSVSKNPDKCVSATQIYPGRMNTIPLMHPYKKGTLELKVVNGRETYVKDYQL